MTGWWGWPHEPDVQAAMQAGASQDPWELAGAMDLVRGVDPSVVVEIGCDRGGTLLAWHLAAPAARVIGITLPDNGAATGGSGAGLVDHGAEVIARDSHDPAARAELAMALAGEPVDVLVIDGDHSEAGVRADLAMYGPLVAQGGLILLHDITSVPDGMRPVEVARVWPELRARYACMEVTNPEGPAQGWGVITVADGDRFAELATGCRG